MKSYKSEKEFLKNYDIHDFDVPLTSVDLCIFSIVDQSLKVLLVKRNDYPFKDRWALPGGFIDIAKDENLEVTASRKLEEKTAVKTHFLEQIESIGNIDRDPRGWSITVLYFALLSHSDAKISFEEEDVEWVHVKDVNDYDLAFDHHLLFFKAISRLQRKVSYTTLPMHILPKMFTLAQLQQAYEIIIGRDVEKKSFRRRIEASNLLFDTGEVQQDSGRPAKLYSMRKGCETHFYERSI